MKTVLKIAIETTVELNEPVGQEVADQIAVEVIDAISDLQVTPLIKSFDSILVEADEDDEQEEDDTREEDDLDGEDEEEI